MVIQRCLDVEQRTGDVEQGFLIGSTQAIRDLVEHAALLADHAARNRQRQHAQRVADTLKHFTLSGQLGRVGILLTQEQIERFLHAQQIVLERAGNRVKQGPVVTGHGAARVFQLTRIRQQRIKAIGTAQQIHVRAALLGLGHDVEQPAGDFIRLATAQALFALFNQQADVAIDLADQLTHFTRMGLQCPLFQALQHASGDPPQAAAMHVIAACRDGQQRLAHVDQLRCRVLPTEPAKQLLLEAQAQISQLGAMRLGIGLAHRRRRLFGQEGIQIGAEHRRFGQRFLTPTGPQVIEQRQQHHGYIAVTAGEPFQVVGQLHQATHQRGIGFFTLGDVTFEQGDGEGFHLRTYHGRAIQLDHLQGALHLMQMIRAGAHVIALAWIVDVRLQRLAGDRQGIVELRLDPLQRREIDVVLKSHAPLSTVAQRQRPATIGIAPCLVLFSITPKIGTAAVNPAA